MNDKRYAILFLAVFLGFATLVWLPTALLWRSGETWPVHWIVDHQLRHGSVWSHGLIDKELQYKHALYAKTKPDIVAFGTSRILQIRADMFEGRFLNMGRGVTTTALDRDIASLLATHTPRLVLWGIDYWLVSEIGLKSKQQWQATAGLISGLSLEGRIVPELVPKTTLNVWSLVRAGTVPPQSALQTILKGSAFPGPRLGLRATTMEQSGGYLPDGSYVYFDAYLKPERGRQAIVEQLKRNTQSNSVYAMRRADRISATVIGQIRNALAMFTDRGVKLVLYTPPLPIASLHIVESVDDFRAFMSEFTGHLSRLARENGAEFYDSAELLNIPLSEFIDAIHPGETANARLLLELNKRGSAVGPFLKQGRLQEIISRNSGRATISRPLYGRFGIVRPAL